MEIMIPYGSVHIRPGAEVLGIHVLEYIFEVLVLILVEIMVMYSYSYLCSMYSDFTSTLQVHQYFFQYDIVKII